LLRPGGCVLNTATYAPVQAAHPAASCALISLIQVEFGRRSM
jgi:hypothetical protein